MLTSERKSLIADRVRQEGRLVAKSFAEELGLSEDTIRRDLREMAAEGLLARVHGGALPLQPSLPDFTARKAVATDEKRKLGRLAASLVGKGQTVFLDGGTTNAEIARALPREFAFTVVTHSPTIASELEHHPTAEIILIGGRIYRHSMVAVGSIASAAVAGVRPDIFFMGATAAHVRHGFTTGDLEEAAIKRQIAEQSARTYVALTVEKFERVSPAAIMPIGHATGVLVAERPDVQQIDALSAAGVEVLIG
jgi:DeoR/GlpR family transcriptional regulator of sugar metabolism